MDEKEYVPDVRAAFALQDHLSDLVPTITVSSGWYPTLDAIRAELHTIAKDRDAFRAERDRLLQLRVIPCGPTVAMMLDAGFFHDPQEA